MILVKLICGGVVGGVMLMCFEIVEYLWLGMYVLMFGGNLIVVVVGIVIIKMIEDEGLFVNVDFIC